MNPGLGPFAIAATLLVLGGGLKVARPHDTAVAMRGMRIPSSDSLVRVGGAAEVVIGLAALTLSGRVPAALVLASYALFTAFVVVALVRRLPIASCGCFGRADTPPDALHVGVTVGAAIAALALVVDPGRSPLDVMGEDVLESLAYVALVGVGVAAALLVLTLLPRTLALARGHATGRDA